jgi:hypothetical protein
MKGGKEDSKRLYKEERRGEIKIRKEMTPRCK